ncbi:MAG: hypothetical protein J5I93_10825 [Pirellulaceae bacterium]|nr:hypothetical protein [Pirellulaceae bacterium]
MAQRRLYGLLVTLVLLAAGGCQHIGPGTILDDRIPYNDAIVTSWKQQTLLNIVRLRYLDVPEFVDVPSVVSGYEHGYTTSAGIAASIAPSNSLATLWQPNLLWSRGMVDRPTISYTPQTGSEFTRNLTNPIPPVAILNLIESGNPADVVMALAVESINGVRNRGFSGQMQEADPEFRQVIQTMKRAQASGHVSLRVVPGGDPRNSDVVLGIRDESIPAELASELDQMRTLLRLDPEVREFRIVFGMLPKEKDEIAFRTRSVLRILSYLAFNVQVPESHLADGRAVDVGAASLEFEPQLTVFSGCDKPQDVYAAVHYQGYWFWIDPRDLPSKRTFVYLKFLLALADTQQREAAPALTIRAN